jgi:predicted transcriptional regulator
MEGNLIFKGKHIRILLALRDTTQNWYITTLAKASDTTYVHTCNFIGACEHLGIIGSEKHGKIKLVKLTEKGARLAEMLAGAYSIVNGAEKEKEKENGKEAQPQKPAAAEPAK